LIFLSSAVETNNDNRQQAAPQSIQVLKYEAELLQEQVYSMIFNFEIFLCFD
jgi:hypothetical protein